MTTSINIRICYLLFNNSNNNMFIGLCTQEPPVSFPLCTLKFLPFRPHCPFYPPLTLTAPPPFQAALPPHFSLFPLPLLSHPSSSPFFLLLLASPHLSTNPPSPPPVLPFSIPHFPTLSPSSNYLLLPPPHLTFSFLTKFPTPSPSSKYQLLPPPFPFSLPLYISPSTYSPMFTLRLKFKSNDNVSI